jgi:arginine-tRNA-protein transferase
VTEHKTDFPQFYITAPQPCPYLPGKLERKLFTHLSNGRSPTLIDNLLRGGFRRSQNIAYMPYCDACSACVPVRILVDEFEPKRTLKRIRRANRDLEARRIGAVPTSEQYSLFRDYLDHRHSDGGMADMSVLDYAMMVEDSVVDTQLTEYRIRTRAGESREKGGQNRLVGVTLFDRLSDGVSMVYSFYDPMLSDRSLGSYMILEHIEYARALGLPYVYLGYWIKDSPKMDYKTRFRPQERLTARGWVRA